MAKKNLYEDVCSLGTALKLKKFGYNKFCNLLYCTDFTYNGKSISYEEELDLKFAGKGSEIKEVLFGRIIGMSNFNKENDENSCSAPYIYDVIDWLRENYAIVIHNEPFYMTTEQVTLYTPKIEVLNLVWFQKYEDANYMRDIYGENYFGVLDMAIAKAIDIINERNEKLNKK